MKREELHRELRRRLQAAFGERGRCRLTGLLRCSLLVMQPHTKTQRHEEPKMLCVLAAWCETGLNR